MVESFGAKCIITNDSFTEEDLAPFARNDFGWMKLKTEIQDIFMGLKPDIVVCDFISKGGVWAADQLKIPVVINLPGPLEIVPLLCFPLPDSRK